MLAFVDESGDTGFRFDRNSSPYFVVAMILVPGADEAEKLRLAIDELKEELRKPSMEFHFTNTDGATRQKFFNAIRNHDFIVVAAVCDKGKLQTLKGNHAEFLLSTFGATMEHARDKGLLDAANIKYDEAGGNAFQRKLSSQLMAKVNGAERGKYIKQCEPQSSTGNNLIQLADMVCGAIARPYNKPQRQSEVYMETIKHRVDSVLQWP